MKLNSSIIKNIDWNRVINGMEEIHEELCSKRNIELEQKVKEQLQKERLDV